MREYGKVHTTLWASGTLRDVGDDARLLALYLLTSPHTNAIGAFRLPDAYACDDLGWDAKRFRNGLETLSKAGFIQVDEPTRWVWIVKFLDFNRPENPNVRKAAIKLAQCIPDSVEFKASVVQSLTTSERVSEPLRNPPSLPPSLSPSLEGVQGEVVNVPLDDGSEHPVTAADLAEFKSAYPRIDPLAEARKARAWCLANAANRKTRRGVGKFLNGWMARAQKDAESKPVSQASKPGGGRREL